MSISNSSSGYPVDKFFLTANVDRWEDFRCGSEPLGFDTVDFWEWYAGYSIDASVRGGLAEFLVMKALGFNQKRSHWGNFDLLFHGKGIEIKSSSKISCKHPERKDAHISENCRISFDIRKRHHHIVGGSWTERDRCSDLYIFCLLLKVPVTDVSNWEFYPVLSSDLDLRFGDAKTISLSKLRSFVDPVSYSDLRHTTEKIIFGGRNMCKDAESEEREREEQVLELQRLIACYQIASRDDKNVVWAALNKYVPHIS